MVKKVFYGVLFLVVIFAQMSLAQALEPQIISVDTTDDGSLVLITSSNYHGLNLVNNITDKIDKVSKSMNSGYYATISPDKRFVCYKGFKMDKDAIMQAPMLYDIEQKKSIMLSDWSSLVGTPVVATNGNIAYTVGNEMFITNAFSQVQSINLGYHVNLLTFSPDGSKLTFSDYNGQIVVLEVGQNTMITLDGSNYWWPKFSPQGDQILARTINDKAISIDLKNKEIKAEIKGEALGWVNNETFACLEKIIDEKEGKVKKSSLVLMNTTDGTSETIELIAGDANAVLKGDSLAIVRNNKLECGKVKNKNLYLDTKPMEPEVPTTDYIRENKKEKSNTGDFTILTKYENSSEVYLSPFPYIHQVYDTPNEFNGHWACGASSALMAIQYYNVLSTHPITVSVPYSHTSDYGWYVSNVYTHGQKTFNIYSDDPSGNSFAGGYGYITQNDWEDTKGHMRDYIQYHGRGSSVDWSPTWTELQSDINNNHPFVVLTSLTSSGHYITCRGYMKNQHTAIFQDPYGDKNYQSSDGYPNYIGYWTRYDWPGYNNGYVNLSTVHCYIYCR
ncbi:MAG: C39 family peptidase [Halanaerobiales bacterium]|nr:C39 family peptidase [Halanaerobiales bacterium]